MQVAANEGMFGNISSPIICTNLRNCKKCGSIIHYGLTEPLSSLVIKVINNAIFVIPLRMRLLFILKMCALVSLTMCNIGYTLDKYECYLIVVFF